ncbi:MAG: C-GCAxxG-C-C family protein [Roseiarcus sp.]
MERAAIPEVRKRAEDSFASGLFCAESVVMAIAGAEGVESELLPRAATAFCSGMARSGGACGALSGAIMGVGLALGRSSAKESVEPAYVATRRVIEDFEHEFGARDCRALLGGCDLNTPEGQALFKDQNLGRRCLQFTSRAAEIAARVIVESQG